MTPGRRLGLPSVLAERAREDGARSMRAVEEKSQPPPLLIASFVEWKRGDGEVGTDVIRESLNVRITPLRLTIHV
jgi:hypothetical protein